MYAPIPDDAWDGIFWIAVIGSLSFGVVMLLTVVFG